MRLSSMSAGLVAVVVGFTACASPEPNPAELAEAVGSVTQAIEGGYLDSVDTAVVGIVTLSNGGVGACSGTLIAPNVVLTAQHCVATLTTGEQVDCAKSTFGSPHQASSMYVTTKAVLSQNPADYRGVKEVIVPLEKGPVCGNDVAILVLVNSVDAADATPRIPRVDVPAEQGELYYAVGYGLRGENGPSGTRYRRDQLKLRCVAANCKSSQVDDAEWLGDTGVCQGDSGGPACDEQDRVVGVVSRGAPGCAFPVYGHVASWAEFIKSNVVKASVEAGLPTPAWATGFSTDRQFSYPIGAACTVTSECPSNACLDGYCTRMCSPEAACPDGYECASNGYCAQTKAPVTTGGSGTTTEVTEDAGCSLTRGQDPTKPIPWIVTLGAALAWSARSRSRRRD